MEGNEAGPIESVKSGDLAGLCVCVCVKGVDRWPSSQTAGPESGTLCEQEEGN